MLFQWWGKGGCDKWQACTESFYSCMYGHCVEFMQFFQSKMVFLRPEQKCLFMQRKTYMDVKATGAMLSCRCLWYSKHLQHWADSSPQKGSWFGYFYHSWKMLVQSPQSVLSLCEWSWAACSVSANWECRWGQPFVATSRVFPVAWSARLMLRNPLNSVQISMPVLSKGWITPAAVGRNPLARDGGHCSFLARQHRSTPNHTAGGMSATLVCCFLCMVLEESPSHQV